MIRQVRPSCNFYPQMFRSCFPNDKSFKHRILSRLRKAVSASGEGPRTGLMDLATLSHKKG